MKLIPWFGKVCSGFCDISISIAKNEICTRDFSLNSVKLYTKALI